MTAKSSNDFDSVDYSYKWEDGPRDRILEVSKVESGNVAHVHQLVAEEIAKELRELGKVVIYRERQIALGWAECNFNRSTGIKVTAQAWNGPFELSVYDAC